MARVDAGPPGPAERPAAAAVGSPVGGSRPWSPGADEPAQHVDEQCPGDEPATGELRKRPPATAAATSATGPVHNPATAAAKFDAAATHISRAVPADAHDAPGPAAPKDPGRATAAADPATTSAVHEPDEPARDARHAAATVPPDAEAQCPAGHGAPVRQQLRSPWFGQLPPSRASATAPSPDTPDAPAATATPLPVPAETAGTSAGPAVPGQPDAGPSHGRATTPAATPATAATASHERHERDAAPQSATHLGRHGREADAAATTTAADTAATPSSEWQPRADLRSASAELPHAKAARAEAAACPVRGEPGVAGREPRRKPG